jgi:hypothetical protein
MAEEKGRLPPGNVFDFQGVIKSATPSDACCGVLSRQRARDEYIETW